MAKNISLLGADYPDVPAVVLPKTGGGSAMFVDLDDMNDVENALAIVVDGDTAPKAITAGQYLFIKNHSTLASGGYHATDAITSGGAITASNVAADADGISNAISGKIEGFIFINQPASVQAIINALPNIGDTAVVRASGTVSAEYGLSGVTYGIWTKATASRYDFVMAKQNGYIVTGCANVSGNSYTITKYTFTHKETVTVTKGTGITSISTNAYKVGNLITVSGYTLIPAGTYTDQNGIFKLSAAPSYDVFFNDNKGRQMRVRGTGDVVFHASTTLSAAEYVFYNFSYAV